MSDPDRIGEVLDFWLDEVGPDGWYERSAELDAAVTRRFGALWEEARRRPFLDWLITPRGALALIILLDQFPRNMHRGTALAHASDRLALRAAKVAIGRGDDLKIEGPPRQFFYLPLMHSEVLADQERAIRLIATRLDDRDENLKHGIGHRDVIRRFGRFPSRNSALGRADSEGERNYRAEGGYMG